MKITKQDQKILDDYQDFRKARFEFHVKQREWVKMSKKTKKALINAFTILHKKHSNDRVH